MNCFPSPRDSDSVLSLVLIPHSYRSMYELMKTAPITRICPQCTSPQRLCVECSQPFVTLPSPDKKMDEKRAFGDLFTNIFLTAMWRKRGRPRALWSLIRVFIMLFFGTDDI
jgi:hypothetical protein